MNGGRNCNMLFYDGDMEISIGAAFVFPGKDTKKMVGLCGNCAVYDMAFIWQDEGRRCVFDYVLHSYGTSFLYDKGKLEKEDRGIAAHVLCDYLHG